MNRATLESILARHGLAIDECRRGAGQFRDLYIGTGAPHDTLRAALAEIKAAGWNLARIDHGNVIGHKACGKPYIEIGSFWWE